MHPRVSKPADYVLLDGRLVERRAARIAPGDLGLLVGDGAFETLRADDGVAAELAAHLQRLGASLQALGIVMPWTPADLAASVPQLLKANGLQRGCARIRFTVTRGTPPPVAPTLLVTADAYAPPPAAAYDGGVEVEISRHVREPHPLHGIKATSYQACLWQRREASRAQIFEVLQFNTRGHLAEGSCTNVFLVDASGWLATPRPDEGCLAGVTRGVVLELARHRGMEVREGGIERDELAAAAEVFLTNSLIELLPVRAIDGRVVGVGRPGPVAPRLAAAYALRVRNEARLAPGS